jgi:hypothetical protein
MCPSYAAEMKVRFFANTGWCFVIAGTSILIILLLLIARINKNNFIIWLLMIPNTILFLFWKLFKYDLFNDHSVQAMSKLKQEHPWLFDFMTSHFKQAFDLFIGRGRIYHNSPEVSNYDFSNVDLFKLNPTGELGLQKIHIDLIGFQLRNAAINMTEPPLDLVEEMVAGKAVGVQTAMFGNVKPVDPNSIEL